MKGIPKEDLLDLLAMFPDDGIVPFDYIRGLYKSYADVYVSDYLHFAANRSAHL